MGKKQQYHLSQYKLWAVVSLLLSCALLISLSFNLSHPKTKYISQTLALPEIDAEPTPSPEAEEEEDTGWKTITTRKGDTLGRIFKREKLSQQTLQAILHSSPYAKNMTNIKPHQSFHFSV
jgi:cell envelope opacity-associated protein A